MWSLAPFPTLRGEGFPLPLQVGKLRLEKARWFAKISELVCNSLLHRLCPGGTKRSLEPEAGKPGGQWVGALNTPDHGPLTPCKPPDGQEQALSMLSSVDATNISRSEPEHPVSWISHSQGQDRGASGEARVSLWQRSGHLRGFLTSVIINIRPGLLLS